MSITVGYRTYIMQPYEILNYNCRNPDGELPKVRIGKYCSIAKNCSFVLSNHSLNRVTTFPASRNIESGYSRGDICIGNDVWIGTQCIILDGVTIGDGAVCAAGSVISKAVPPYAIVGGNPARIIRFRFSEDIIRRLQLANIWALPDNEIDELDLWTTDIDTFLTSRGV